MCGCLLCAPYWGPGLQPKHVPWLGIEPATLWFTSRRPTHWATPARAYQSYFYLYPNLTTHCTECPLLLPLKYIFYASSVFHFNHESPISSYCYYYFMTFIIIFLVTLNTDFKLSNNLVHWHSLHWLKAVFLKLFQIMIILRKVIRSMFFWKGSDQILRNARLNKVKYAFILQYFPEPLAC